LKQLCESDVAFGDESIFDSQMECSRLYLAIVLNTQMRDSRHDEKKEALSIIGLESKDEISIISSPM